MQLDRFSRVLFIIYCVEAGAVFLLLPWGASWERTIVQIPSELLRVSLLHPFARSLVSAFGVLHLIWAMHDLQAIVSRRRSRPNAVR